MVWRKLLLAADVAQASGGANVLGVALGTVAAVLVAIVGTASFIWIRWKRGEKCANIPMSFHVEEQQKSDSRNPSTVPVANAADKPDFPVAFSYNEIQVATDGFKPELVIKETGYSSVHRAEGPHGEQWAVKRAKGLTAQGEHLFHSEVDFLAKVYHECILPLRGYCAEGGNQILIFDFMKNGTLASWLRPSTNTEGSRPPLTFSQRLSIAAGVSDALKYLHAFRRPTIIHRDVCSDNILLTDDDPPLKPKLGGLGLLKHLPGDGLRMRVANRKGYLDPEYFQTFKVTAKCDVYSLGVVMLELLTGCAPFVQVSRSAAYQPTPLPLWASQAVEAGRVRDIIDPRMPGGEEECPFSVVEAFATLACACVAPLRRDRPDVARVSALLTELQQMPSEGVPMEVALLSRYPSTGRRVVPL